MSYPGIGFNSDNTDCVTNDVCRNPGIHQEDEERHLSEQHQVPKLQSNLSETHDTDCLESHINDPELQEDNEKDQDQNTRQKSSTRRQDTGTTLIRVYRREIILQACYFVLAFFVTFSCFMVQQIILIAERQPTVFLFRVVAVFYPLGGFLNVLVYTRPKITSLRIRYSEYSWLRAFWYVIKAGGDMPRREEHKIVVDVAFPVRSRAFGVLESPSAALPGSPSLAISSGGCLYDGSQSFGTDNIAYSYRSKELWKYNKNDSGGVSASLGFIPEEEVGQSQDEDGNGVLEALRGGRKETED